MQWGDFKPWFWRLYPFADAGSQTIIVGMNVTTFVVSNIVIFICIYINIFLSTFHVSKLQEKAYFFNIRASSNLGEYLLRRSVQAYDSMKIIVKLYLE